MPVFHTQTLAKWCARMALGLSNSVPGLLIAPENINEIDDICRCLQLTADHAGLNALFSFASRPS